MGKLHVFSSFAQYCISTQRFQHFFWSIFGLNWAFWRQKISFVTAFILLPTGCGDASTMLLSSALRNSALANQESSPWVEAGDFNLFPASCRLSQRRYVYGVLSYLCCWSKIQIPNFQNRFSSFCMEAWSVAGLQAAYGAVAVAMRGIVQRENSVSAFLRYLCASSSADSECCAGRTPVPFTQCWAVIPFALPYFSEASLCLTACTILPKVWIRNAAKMSCWNRRVKIFLFLKGHTLLLTRGELFLSIGKTRNICSGSK